VDVRLVTATNRDLSEAVKAGRFREDLFYRLNVLPLTIPPLRERAEDIPLLARHFMKRFAQEENRAGLKHITREAEALLCAYDWPGNIRQLENAIFRAVVLAEGDELTIDEFPQIAAQMDGFALDAVERTLAPPLAPDAAMHPAHAARQLRPEPAPVPATTYGWLKLVGENGQVRAIEELEADIIRFAIEIYNGRMSEVARRLGIGRSTLYRKLKDYGLEDVAEKSGS
jgi:DNA-binding NtrC family response regulator